MSLDPSIPPGLNKRQMVMLARQRAEKLLQGLLRQRQELLEAPPDLPPDQLDFGTQCLERAIASARRMLDGLEEAQLLARDLDVLETFEKLKDYEGLGMEEPEEPA